MAQMATVTKLIPRDEVTLHGLARECLERASGKRERALRLMRKRLEEPALHRTLIEPMIELAVETALRQAQSSSRTQAKRAAVARVDRGDDTTGLRQMAENIREECFLTYGISSGVLGDATREDLLAEKEQHLKRAEGSQKMANLFGYLARNLQKKSVRQQFSEQELAEAFAKYLRD